MPRTRAPSRPTATPDVTRQNEPAHDFDSWAEELKKKGTGCSACADNTVSQTITALLNSMVKKRAYKITIHEIHRMVLKRHPGSGVGPRGIERHLLSCVRDLYDQARGRNRG